MSCYRIYYQEGVKKLAPVNNRESYLRLRHCGRQKNLVGQARKGNDEAKRRLLQCNYSCLPAADGKLKGCQTPSRSFGMDIDHLTPEQMRQAVERMLAEKETLGLLMLEKSVSGQGYHAVMRRHPELTQEENLQWASRQIGVPYDAGAKDLTRVFFTTTASEEDLLFLSDELFDNRPCDPPSAPIAVAPAPVEPAPAATESAEPQAEVVQAQQECYLGIPYAEIIQTWWRLFNGGQTPVKSNRDVLTFELAVNLRHICGFDRALMDRVIPCYDEFPEEQKLKCIDSALAEKRTQLPKRLREVLDTLRKARADDPALQTALDEIEAEDSLYYYHRIPRMPMGVRESVEAAGHAMTMPTLIAIAPAIGALATEVKLSVHGKPCGLNLCSFVTGEFASNKGKLDDIIGAWMHELQAEADLYTRQEEEWAAQAKRMKSGKVPAQPKLPVRILTLNNTVANLAERLANTDGKHAFSFTPEADNVALKWKQSVSDFSVMLRQAYDEARYDREAKSAEAVRVHIPQLRWNVTLCGTQDALYRVVTNYTDGLLSRLSIARTPDNTFAPLEEYPPRLTAELEHEIWQVAHLLPLLKGEVDLPRLEERGRQWLERIRKEALKNDDRVLARQRFRGCVNAQRITCALWLPAVMERMILQHGFANTELRLRQNPACWIELLHEEETEEMLTLFDIVADYLIENDLYYFRSRLQQAYESRDYVSESQTIRWPRGPNDSIFNRLDRLFSFEQAMLQAIAVKGNGTTHNSVRQMLKNWRKQGLIVLKDGKFEKLCASPTSAEKP